MLMKKLPKYVLLWLSMLYYGSDLKESLKEILNKQQLRQKRTD